MLKSSAVLLGLVLTACYYRGVNVRGGSVASAAVTNPVRWTDLLGEDPFVIDGLLNYTVRRDPTCRRDCRSKLVPLADMSITKKDIELAIAAARDTGVFAPTAEAAQATVMQAYATGEAVRRSGCYARCLRSKHRTSGLGRGRI